MSRPSQEKIEEWMAKGFEHVQMGDTERAQRIGRRLIKHRHTSGFEILALALGQEHELDEAIKVLEEGVAIAPGLWLLWQLLGNYRSDNEDYNGAHRAYDSALKCERVDEDSLRFNIAMVFARQKRPEEALRELDQVAGQWMQPRADALRAHILQDLGRGNEALAVAHEAKEMLNDLTFGGDEDAPVSVESFASVYERLGRVFLALDEREAAQECVLNGLHCDRTYRGILSLVRDLDGQYAPHARYFRALIEGEWPDDPDDPELQNMGFFTTYDMVAETSADVLDWVRRFEPEETHASLRVAELEEFDECPDKPLGVYCVTGYELFPRENGHD